MEHLTTKGISKPDRIKAVIKNRLGKITKKEILKLCPDISTTTVERTLTQLQKDGTILKISGGRYAAYIFNWENTKDLK